MAVPHLTAVPHFSRSLSSNSRISRALSPRPDPLSERATGQRCRGQGMPRLLCSHNCARPLCRSAVARSGVRSDTRTMLQRPRILARSTVGRWSDSTPPDTSDGACVRPQSRHSLPRLGRAAWSMHWRRQWHPPVLTAVYSFGRRRGLSRIADVRGG